jgi:hypothetical protein
MVSQCVENNLCCGVVKWSGQSGVGSECVDITWFRRLVHQDSCFDHEQVRHVLLSVRKYSSTCSARNQKQRYWRWILVFLMCVHQRSCVASRMCAKASLLDVNQEQYAKCECFSDLMSVRAEKARGEQVPLCFWCAVPLHTDPPTYDRRFAPSCIHLQLHVKGSVRLFSTHCETIAKISENPLSCLY